MVRAAVELQERSEIALSYVAGDFFGQGTISEIVRM